MEREHTQNEKKLESLLLKTNQHLKLKLDSIKEATSTVETLTMQDRAFYVPDNGETELPPGQRSTATSVEQQQNANMKLLYDQSRCFHRQILSELERVQSLIQHHKENTHKQLFLREQNISLSICKLKLL